MHTPAPIAVIGAGIAGLSCTTALQQAGMPVQLFDKSRGPAGRMSTRRGEGWACDHGAQYFTARDPRFQAELARWLEAGVAARWAPRLQVLGGLGEHRPDAGIERWVGLPQMTAPARWLAAQLHVTLNATVTALRRSSDGERAPSWQLHTAEQGWLPQHFSAVLLALPAPQAAALLELHAPALSERCSAVRMRGCWALMLQYREPLELPFDAAFVNRGPLRWIARNSSKPGRGGAETWLLHAEAEWSEAHLEQASEQVAALMLRAFAEHGGQAPEHWTLHRWSYADSAPALDAGCDWNAEAGLGLCGDWLHGGKVEGAWLSGLALAEALLRERRPA
ncbi:NAD(P)-binding protein [Paucibacter sp. APW11]|uniref:NAD(P)-binding protein n=1 Tax=Roseateles aquae TaxID=3077235 RepID=A0ABU3PK16_9BURK|nr:FAD-dependent oxidoreductase [Paucibacter sp. APW11]MDT9002386.1 NAD(P)-binding protein [Paucibacter sp. APW11]